MRIQEFNFDVIFVSTLALVCQHTIAYRREWHLLAKYWWVFSFLMTPLALIWACREEQDVELEKQNFKAAG